MWAEQFRILQAKARPSLLYLNWFFVFISFIINLLPILINCDQQRRGIPTGFFAGLNVTTVPVDSSTVIAKIQDPHVDDGHNLHLAMIMGPFLGMCLPATLDLVVELYVTKTQPKTELNANNVLEIVRLSVLERAVFIVGVICNGFYFLIPSDYNIMVIYTVKQVTTNLTSLLLGAPIIIFLERCTNVFPPFLASLIIFLLSLGCAMSGYLYNVANGSMSFDAASTITLVAIALTLSACLWSFVKYLFRQQNETEFSGSKVKEQLNPFKSFSTTSVPACHMMTLCIGFLIGIALVLPDSLSLPVFNILYALMLFALALVFVVEMRIRQNEVFIGLTQLDIKHYEAKVAEAEAAANAFVAEQEKAAKEREMQLTLELRENIINSAHDVKSPTTALGLAVESLLHGLDNKKPLPEARRQRMIGTLHGMEHTISALTMIINRSVDACLSASSDSAAWIVPNNVPLHLKQIMDEIVAFSKWQADGSGIEVVMEPLPDDLPEEIMMDEKWLKDDLLCLAGNVVKYSRGKQKTPAVIRLTIVPSSNEITSVPSSPSSSVHFSFIDSGYPLSEERLTNLFSRPVHTERTQVGGMGLGLFCLSEHVKALHGQYGARKRTDGRDGTEIWFSFPLIVPKADQDKFEMDDLEYDKYEPNTLHDHRNFLEKEALSTNNNVHSATSATTSVADKAFSSPQNRRASIKSASSSLPLLGHFMGSLRDRTTPRSSFLGTVVIGRENVAGGMNNKRDDFVPREIDKAVSPETLGIIGATATAGDNPAIVAAVDDDPITHREARTNADRMQEVIGTMSILIVDDSVSIIKMTKNVIQNECANITFMEAKDGNEAFERVAEAFSSFKLIVTDIQMPQCNGFDFTRKVRQLERDKGLTPKLIIGISANDQQKISAEAKESGMDGFMHKPFKLSTLMDVIEHINIHRKQLPPIATWPLAVASHQDKQFDSIVPTVSKDVTGLNMTSGDNIVPPGTKTFVSAGEVDDKFALHESDDIPLLANEFSNTTTAGHSSTAMMRNIAKVYAANT